jgi:hypothetical protein
MVPVGFIVNDGVCDQSPGDRARKKMNTNLNKLLMQNNRMHKVRVYFAFHSAAFNYSITDVRFRLNV